MSRRLFAVLVLTVFLVSSCVVQVAFATDVETEDTGNSFINVYNKYLSVDSFPKSVVRVVGDDVKIRYKGGEITLCALEQEEENMIRMTDRKAIVFGGAFKVENRKRKVIVSTLSIVNQDGSLESVISNRLMKTEGTIQKASDNSYEFKAGDMIMKVEGVEEIITEGIQLREGMDVFIEGFYNEVLNKLYVYELMDNTEKAVEISGVLTKNEEEKYRLEMVSDDNIKEDMLVKIDPDSIQAPIAMEESLDKMVELSGKVIYDNDLEINIFEVFKVMSAKDVEVQPEVVILDEEEVEESVVSSVYNSIEEVESVVDVTYGEQDENSEIEVIVDSEPAELTEEAEGIEVSEQTESENGQLDENNSEDQVVEMEEIVQQEDDVDIGEEESSQSVQEESEEQPGEAVETEQAPEEGSATEEPDTQAETEVLNE